MTTIRFSTAILVFFAPILRAENWPQWRGPSATGVSPEKGLQVEWSNDKNIAWRAELGGLGASSPVVWGERVFVTYQTGAGGLRPGRHPTFVQEGNPAELGETPLGGSRAETKDERISFGVAAYHASDGRRLWHYNLDAEGDLPEVHEKRNLATSSPATDGDHVYAWFSNGQLAALDVNGKLAWKRHLGIRPERSTFSFGISGSQRHVAEMFLGGFCSMSALRNDDSVIRIRWT